MKLVIRISERNGDLFQARCPSLPGCVVYGHSLSEVRQRIQEAIQGYVASMDVALPRELARLACIQESNSELAELVA